ncbi:zinc finger BED domain-containing protein 6-like [Anomaloglossus baeobatrachus]
MSAATAHRAEEMSAPKPTQKISPAWHFYHECADDKTLVVCTLCSQILKRGLTVKTLSTTCMSRHLNAKHKLQWSTHLKNLETSEAPPAPSNGTFSDSSSCSQLPGPPGSTQEEDVTTPPPAASPNISTQSHGSPQLSILQTLKKKRKYPPTHPKAMVLNDRIARFLVFEMLPFQLVETDSFKKLMALAVPHYVVPSRHYFSRRAMPALHTQVAENIRSALHHAISGKVHITADTWTSKHRQGHYISLTAHWVNVVEAGPEVEGVLAHVLPPPRIAGRSSVHVPSSSNSASSTTSSSGQSKTCTTNFSTARGKRQRAVLKFICLGEISQTVQDLWTGIKQQTDEWLLPVNLKPGLMMCDNGRNLIAALELGNMTHIPCLGHVLNLVVQSFLTNYPHMSELLQKAMIDEVVAQEEEEQEPPLSGQSSTHGSEGGFLYQEWPPGTQVSSQGTVFKDEEEEEEESCSQQDESQSSSKASLEHGWGDTEDPDNIPPTEDSFLLPLGSLAHMSQYMLVCLHNDLRVARIVSSADYWLATLLDPRYKDNVPSLLPSVERDRKMREFKLTLVESLLTAFPPDSEDSGKEQGRGGEGSGPNSWSTGTTSEGRVIMAEMWNTFFSTPQDPEPSSDSICINRRQRFSNMVEEYVSTRVQVPSDGSAPFNFWVSKLDTWPELALYSLEVLACPAASVLSQRVFSIAGGGHNDKRANLSEYNVSKLTFIKMNQAWITQDLSGPLAD